MHRAWMDVKALFSANDDDSMLEEAIRGEKASVEEYDEVSKDVHLPNKYCHVVERPKDENSRELSRVKSMEDFS